LWLFLHLDKEGRRSRQTKEAADGILSVAQREPAADQGGIPGTFRHRAGEEGRGNVESSRGQIGEFQETPM